MQTPQDKDLLAERRQWMDSLVSIDRTRALLHAQITKLSQQTVAAKRACSFCDRSHTDPVIEAVAYGLAGASICNICLFEATPVGADGRKKRAKRGGGVPVKAMPLYVRDVFDAALASHGYDAANPLSPTDGSTAAVRARDWAIYSISQLTGPSGRQVSVPQIADWMGRDRGGIRNSILRYVARAAA